MKKNPIHLLPGLLFSLQLFSQPVITLVTPVSGNVGTPVVIKGTGFGTTPSANIVYFGSVKANISASTDTAISVTVPAGATYQPVSVTTNNLTAYSTNSFNATFAGGNEPFTTNFFIPKIDHTIGIYPHSIAFGDFNGDSKNDVLVSRGSSGNVSVLRNTSSNGSISFAPQSDFAATGNNHEGCAIGDLDGDGKLDFIITNSHNVHSVSVYRNTSTGNTISFASKIDFAADNSPYSVAIGDLDQDGKPDMIIINAGTGSDKVSVYKNTSTPGNISFGARVDFATGTSPYSIAVGDLNGDGKPELAITTQYNTSALSVMKNTTSGGTISFEPPVNYVTFSGPFIVSIGDLDTDGKPDLAAVSSGSNAVVILRNTSEAGNLSFAADRRFATGSYPVCVSIGDLDGDGKPDLTTSNRYGNSVSALRNTSTTGTISFDNPVNYAVDEAPLYVAVGDLDGDQRPDIVTANSSSNTVSVLRNIVGANIAPAISSFTPTSGNSGTTVIIKGTNFTGATAVKFGNVPASSFIVDSATGITAVTGAGASGSVSVTTNNGTATLAGFNFTGPIINSFSPTTGIAGTIVTISGSNFTNVTAVKFGGTPAAFFTVNSSTTITATVGTGSGGSVSVTTANGVASLAGFSFGTPTITSITPASGHVGSTVTITGTNFNSVPADNIVFFGAVKATVSTASPTQLSVIVPAGATYQPVSITNNYLTAYSSLPFNTTFDSDSTEITTNSFAVAGNYGTGTYPSAISISDLNNDGKPDLITANSVSNNTSILKNTSEPGLVSFNTKLDLATGRDPKRIAVGDLDGDGKPDIAVSNTNAGNASTISIFRNTSIGGTLSFNAKTDYSSGNGSIGISMADMNGDGKPDIIVASGNSGIFSIFINTTVSAGAISFAPKQDFTLFTHPDNLTTADLDKDGLPDIIICNSTNGSISIYRNTSVGGNLSIAPVNQYAVGSFPSFVTTGDLNGDGKIDVVVTNYSSGTVSLFQNTTTSSFITLAAMQDQVLATTNIAIGDLNGDGKPDLCTGRWLSGMISVLENTYAGPGNFSFGGNIEFTTGNFDTFVSVGDLDGDGKPELAIVNTIHNTVTILKNKIGIPEISTVSATTSNRGTTVTLNGRNLAGATSVKFGGMPASSFTVISPEKIDAIVGGGASGDITVTTPQGTAVKAGFNFIPEISSNGPTTFCSDQAVILSSSADANNQWYKDGVAISGANATTLQVNASGNYHVKTTGNGVTTSSPAGIPVTVTIIPAPVITRNANNNLVSSAATGNQWYLNGNIIPGATNPSYQPAENGNYTVSSTVNGCTSNFSAPYNFVITGIINLENGQYINLYPNPVRDQLNINWNINGAPLLNIEITDLRGKQMQVNKNIQNGTTIDLSRLPEGLYFIKIYNEQFKINETIKIFKED